MLRTHRELQLGRLGRAAGTGWAAHMCLEPEEDPLSALGVPGPGTQAGVTGSWRRSQRPPHWHAGSHLLISLECLALLSRLQDARTMKAFAETLGVAGSGQGPLGQAPTVSSAAFPIAGPSGEACRAKQEAKRHPLARLTHIWGAEACGAPTVRGIGMYVRPGDPRALPDGAQACCSLPFPSG